MPTIIEIFKTKHLTFHEYKKRISENIILDLNNVQIVDQQNFVTDHWWSIDCYQSQK